MYCTWKNTKCRKSTTIISTLKNRPIESCNFQNLLVFGFPERSQNLMSFRELLFSLFHGGDQRKKSETQKVSNVWHPYLRILFPFVSACSKGWAKSAPLVEIGLTDLTKKWGASSCIKVHIFWEGYKTLRNLHPILDYSTYSKVKILQNFVAFSEYMNFTK